MSLNMNKNGFETLCQMEDDEVAELLDELSQHKLKKLSKKINNGRRLLYPENREYKNRNAREVMYEDEIIGFFETVRNERIRYAFLLQLFFALRTSELQRLRVNEKAGMVVVDLLKSDREQRIPIHGDTSELLEWVESVSCLSSQYVRKCFRAIREEAGLDYVYGESSDGRDLHNFKPYALRKTGATFLYRETTSEFKMAEFLGHKNAKSQGGSSTQVYHGYWQEEYREDLESAFEELYTLI